ncbi:MAG: helix-turn-helix domain-containing GNAT family N-acetyltransferase [Acidobacteriota bacterium]
MKNEGVSTAIEAVRKFNRFYTKHIGVVNERWQGSSFSLVETRVLFEIANSESPTATEIADRLGLKKSNLSQILNRLDGLGLIERSALDKDGRHKIVSLTETGRTEFEELNRMASNQVAEILSGLTPAGQTKLIDSMASIENMLGERSPEIIRQVVIRQPEPGDYGWVISANGTLYADEYNWDISYEELVVGIVADFIKTFDPKKEKCWIVELGGENVGCVFLVKETDQIAKLRLLIVDAKARGLGLGKHLVDRCTNFARQAGYKKITLWTQSHLLAARGIYKTAGYLLVRSDPGNKFGHDMVSETWELEL